MSEYEILNKYNIYSKRLFITGILSIIYSLLYGIILGVSYFNSDIIVNILYFTFFLCYNISLLVFFIIFTIWLFFLLESNSISNKSETTSFYKVIQFYIPITNLIKPYGIIKNLWSNLLKDSKSNDNFFIVKIWCFFYILSYLIYKFSMIYSLTIESIESFQKAIFFQYLDLFFNIIYIIILILFMRKINDKLSIINMR